MAYNSSGERLAIGSHDNSIYIYTKGNPYKFLARLQGHSSFITSLDWSASTSNEYIRSTCGAYELLFFDVENLKQDKSGASNT